MLWRAPLVTPVDANGPEMLCGFPCSLRPLPATAHTRCREASGKLALPSSCCRVAFSQSQCISLPEQRDSRKQAGRCTPAHLHPAASAGRSHPLPTSFPTRPELRAAPQSAQLSPGLACSLSLVTSSLSVRGWGAPASFSFSRRLCASATRGAPSEGQGASCLGDAVR